MRPFWFRFWRWGAGLRIGRHYWLIRSDREPMLFSERYGFSVRPYRFLGLRLTHRWRLPDA